MTCLPSRGGAHHATVTSTARCTWACCLWQTFAFLRLRYPRGLLAATLTAGLLGTVLLNIT